MADEREVDDPSKVRPEDRLDTYTRYGHGLNNPSRTSDGGVISGNISNCKLEYK